MFQRILVPLDGSTRSEQAIPTAARIARGSDGTVILLSVIPPVDRIGKTREAEKQRAEADEYLKTLAASPLLSDLSTERHTSIGAIAPTLLEAVESLHADLLVLCRHGSTGFTHWMLGGVAHKLVQHCPIPILLLRSDGRELVTADRHQIRALVTLDGSPFSEAILEPIANLIAGLAQARTQQGTLLLLRVVSFPVNYTRWDSQVDAAADARMQAEAKYLGEQYLETIARRLTEGDLAQYHLAVTTKVASNPDVANAIAHAAEQDLVDVIALATHGWSGVLRWALGSVMERVLHATRTPLFILRPPNE